MYNIRNCFLHLKTYLDYSIHHHSISAYTDVFLIHYNFSIGTHNIVYLTNFLMKDSTFVLCAIIQKAGQIVSLCVCIFEDMGTYS